MITLNSGTASYSSLVNSSATPVTLANAMTIYDNAGFASLPA